jgi:hypothetical protein
MARFKLKRKSFAFLGIGNVAKNWGAMKTAASAGNYGQAALSGAKSIGTAGLYASPVIGAGIAVNKLGGGDLLSGGEKSAKDMKF